MLGAEGEEKMKRMQIRPLSGNRFGNAALAITALGALLWSADVSARATRPSRSNSIAFHDAQRQTREFIRDNERITLTPGQQKLMTQALSSIPAPCCADYSAATCCCECNLARSIWGLSKVLIQDHGATEAQVHAAATEWIAFINTDGFAGNACFTGGCARSFHDDGCGGMDAKRLT
jgi:hypothetical protein